MKSKSPKDIWLIRTVFSAIVIVLFQSGYSQTIPSDSLYFGQKPPGDTALVFAPGIVSVTGRNVPCISFSSDGQSAVFYVGFWPNPGTPYCMISEYANNRWSTPVQASFSAGRTTGEPAFLASGNRIYLFANGIENQVGTVDLAYVERIGSGWGTPKSLGNPPNLAQDQYHPCMIVDSSVYFSTSSGDIAVCRYRNGRYLPREILPFPVNKANTAQTWGDPWVAADEGYMIFKSTREGGYGLNDIYVTYRKEDGTWTNPKNAGSQINTRFDETAGDITPDGKYMTFNSNRTLYWISAGFIETLRQTNFVPYLKSKPKNQSGKAGEPFSFNLPDSTFIDDDGNEKLTFYVTSRLPSGLDFDSDTRTLSGTPTESGTFTVNLLATDPEEASATTSFQLKINAASGIENESFRSGIRLFPNPAKDRLQLSLGDEPFQKAIVQISNTAGEIVLSSSVPNGTAATLDLTGKSAGIYFLQLIIDGEVINRTFYLE
jgi:hypothetical protein